MIAASAARAAHASRAEVQSIGLRSAEVDAVNQALHRGSKAEDLILSGPVLVADESSPPDAEDASPVAAGRARVAELLAAHGSKLGCDVRFFPRKLLSERAELQIDFVFSAPKLPGRWVRESFAGLGATIDDAVIEATGKLAKASLHVIMATLEDESLGADQVEWETWGSFRACLGPLLRQWSSKTRVDFAGYLGALKARLVAAPLSADLHFFRTFVAVDKEVLGFDALLDNETWAPGAELVQSWPWPRADDAYALRHFVALVPVLAS
jgi:hypothetical protein